FQELEMVPNLLEMIGVIVGKASALSIELASESWGGAVLLAWAQWEPTARFMRDLPGREETYRNLEELSGRIERYRAGGSSGGNVSPGQSDLTMAVILHLRRVSRRQAPPPAE